MKKTAFILFLSVFFFVLSTASGWAADNEPYKIGAIVAVTGNASFLGDPQRNTLEMVVDIINEEGGINGRPVELVLYDTESNASRAVTLARRLITRDNVLAVVGPSTSGESMAVIPVVNRAEVPMIAFGASTRIAEPVEERKWVFKVVPGDDLAIRLKYDYMKRNGIDKIAIATASTDYGISGRQHMRELAPEYDIDIVFDDTYGPGETDLTALLTRIRGTEAQAIINWSIGRTQIVITRNWKQLGMTIPLYQSYGFGSARNIEMAEGAAEGVIVPVSRIVIADLIADDDPHAPVVKRYKRLYEERFNEGVSVFGGHAWDAMFQLRDALAEVGPNRSAIREYMENISGFVGNNSIFNRSPQDHVGLDMDAYVMVKVKDGDWAIIDE